MPLHELAGKSPACTPALLDTFPNSHPSSLCSSSNPSLLPHQRLLPASVPPTLTSHPVPHPPHAQAPNYSKVITKPMCFDQVGSLAAAPLQQLLLLLLRCSGPGQAGFFLLLLLLRCSGPGQAGFFLLLLLLRCSGPGQAGFFVEGGMRATATKRINPFSLPRHPGSGPHSSCALAPLRTCAL